MTIIKASGTSLPCGGTYPRDCFSACAGIIRRGGTPEFRWPPCSNGAGSWKGFEAAVDAFFFPTPYPIRREYFCSRNKRSADSDDPSSTYLLYCPTRRNFQPSFHGARSSRCSFRPRPSAGDACLVSFFDSSSSDDNRSLLSSARRDGHPHRSGALESSFLARLSSLRDCQRSAGDLRDLALRRLASSPFSCGRFPVFSSLAGIQSLPIGQLADAGKTLSSRTGALKSSSFFFRPVFFFVFFFDPTPPPLSYAMLQRSVELGSRDSALLSVTG